MNILQNSPDYLISIIKNKPFPEIAKNWLDMANEWITFIKQFKTLDEAIINSNEPSWILFTLRQLGYEKEADHLWQIGSFYLMYYRNTNISPFSKISEDDKTKMTELIKHHYRSNMDEYFLQF